MNKDPAGFCPHCGQPLRSNGVDLEDRIGAMREWLTAQGHWISYDDSICEAAAAHLLGRSAHTLRCGEVWMRLFLFFAYPDPFVIGSRIWRLICWIRRIRAGKRLDPSGQIEVSYLPTIELELSIKPCNPLTLPNRTKAVILFAA